MGGIQNEKENPWNHHRFRTRRGSDLLQRHVYASVSGFSPETSGKLSEKKKNELYRENVDLAIDFYTRFANRIESMLIEQPDCDLISFAGP